MSDEQPEVQPTYGEAITNKLDAYLQSLRGHAGETTIAYARKELTDEIDEAIKQLMQMTEIA